MLHDLREKVLGGLGRPWPFSAWRMRVGTPASLWPGERALTRLGGVFGPGRPDDWDTGNLLGARELLEHRVKSMAQLVRYLYVPIMLIGLNALAFAVVINAYSYAWLAVLLAGAIGLAFAAEHISPCFDEWNQTQDDIGSTTAHVIVYELNAASAVIQLPIIAGLIPWQGIWPHDWPLVAQVLGAILFADCIFTLIHWASHRWPLLWRLHSVHHGVSRLHGLNGFVRHPLHQTLDMIVGTLPLALMGMPVEVALLLGFAISIQLIVQHSNVDIELGPFRDHLSIGRLHHLHHVNWGTEGDCNYGLFFTVWDRMLGTLNTKPPRRIKADDMGIDEVPDFPRQSYLQQLLFPFRYTSEQWRAEGRSVEQSRPRAQGKQPDSFDAHRQ